MNLGDGLMFELENGKPKLVLSHNGASKTSNKTGFCQKSRALKTTTKLLPKEEERDKGCRVAGGVNQGSRKTRAKSRTDGCSRIKQEGLVCLTYEQLQRLLSTIKSSAESVQGGSAAHADNDAATAEELTGSLGSATGEELRVNPHGNQQEEKQNPSGLTPAGLFGTLGEREQKKDAIEAQKAQWRRELDEQMALKKQQSERTKANARGVRRRGAEAGSRSGGPEDRTKQTGTEISNNQQPTPQPHTNTKGLPSAIRSTFVLGEATPLEQAFSEEKKEQQRRWLQDLEQQREEMQLRRKLEKQNQSQPEDHERWAMHFDSFQRHHPVQHPPAAELNLGSARAHHRTPSQALSTVQEDGMGRTRAVTTQGFQPKTSYLRSMTALLDPAQVEEREQRRLKQLEHQRAIEAQMEEQRRQKEKEEAARLAMEQKEERRVARQRDELQQQHLRETQLQKEKEALASHKTEELYRSVQRASEEAQKDKHLQRIKHLQQNGHDVSKMLRTEANSQAAIGQGLPTLDTITEAVDTARKEVAIQTEVNLGSPSPKTSEGLQAVVECKAPSNSKRSRCESRAAVQPSGKENVCTAPTAADNTRPEWNTQKPRKAFVRASERYPAELQRHRQENRMRRQTELMTLVERNTPSRSAQQAAPPQAANSSHAQRRLNSAHQKDEESQGQAASQRVLSPPVPALKHRLQARSHSAAEEKSESCVRPPSSDYVPYVRTDEIHHLDPFAPISRPPTREGAQKTHDDAGSIRQLTPLEQRDPLLHPELLKSTKRQQAILKGLSELRQGLLQKQRELETSFSP